MYKVLLVDDEINIIEGIAKIVNWKNCHAQLIGKAYHGKMAYQMIKKDTPDIVLTDIKMPELNGVQLIEKVHVHHPNVKFIILSGYDEFEFAKTTMKYGVKHYLLKPTNRQKIESALKSVIKDLEADKQRDAFLSKIRGDLKSVLPIAKKHFLKEFIMNKSYGVREWDKYKHLFNMASLKQPLRLIVMVIDDDHNFEHLFALNELGTDMLRGDVVHLSTMIGNKIVILLENQPTVNLNKKIKNIRSLFYNYYELTFTTAISSSAGIEQVQELYKETNDCLTQRFYLGSGSIITVKDIRKYKHNATNTQFNYEDIIFSIRSGNVKHVNCLLQDLFQQIKQENLEVGMVKSYCLELLMYIIRQVKKGQIDIFLQQIVHFQEFKTLQEIKLFIMKIAEEITRVHYDETRKTQHKIIQKVISYVKEHLDDENLSLLKVADEVVYMNPDYLGRLFKKEVGKKFSTYLVHSRVQKAVDLMHEMDEVKVFEIASQVGFGNNPRYFGQVFKKHTGITPSEYKHNSL